MPATITPRSSTVACKACLRLKAKSWWVSIAARPAVSAMSSASRRSGPSGRALLRCSSRWTRPVMTVSRLLKSWATPPASCPTASIFWD
jgi:hypothetical protein